MKLMGPEINNVKNDMSRIGGFSPSQWVLGRFPNRPGGQFDEDTYADHGLLSAEMDANTMFSLKQEIRAAAKKAFVKADCGKRVARAILRKSAPIPGDYSVGDLVCFKREQGANTAETRWSTASRIIGLDLTARRHAGY